MEVVFTASGTVPGFAGVVVEFVAGAEGVDGLEGVAEPEGVVEVAGAAPEPVAGGICRTCPGFRWLYLRLLSFFSFLIEVSNFCAISQSESPETTV